MGRSRSRSRSRERGRGRSPEDRRRREEEKGHRDDRGRRGERERERDRDADRRRDGERGRGREDRSPERKDRERGRLVIEPPPGDAPAEERGGAGAETEIDGELTQADIEIMMEMGLPVEFGTSKGEKHADAGAVKIKSVRTGRQYMNRRGGFNRPLPAEKTGQKLHQV